MNNKITVTGANKIFLAVAILSSVFFLGVEVIDLYYENFLYENIYLILIINQFYFILFPVMLYLIIKKVNIKEVLRINKLDFLPGFLIVLVSLPAYLGALSLNVIIVYILQFTGYTPSESLPAPQNLGALILSALVVAVSPAVCEEILHRGVLLKAYENRGSLKAVVISSILFGVFHYDVTNLVGPIFLGLLIGYYVVRTNSIFAGMLAHFLNNLISTVMQYLVSKGESTQDTTLVTQEQLIAMIIFGIVCFITVMLLVVCFYFATKGKYELKPSRTSVISDVVSIVSHWPILIALILYILFAGIFLVSYIL